MPAIPDLSPALEKMSRLGNTEALALFEGAAFEMAELARHWTGAGLGAAERAALARFRAQLEHAAQLTEQGLTLCGEWENEIPPPGTAYAASGAAASRPARGSLAIEG